MFATWDDVNGHLLARLRPRVLKRVEVVSVIRVAVRQCEITVLLKLGGQCSYVSGRDGRRRLVLAMMTPIRYDAFGGTTVGVGAKSVPSLAVTEDR